jgi:hypothetical protein
MGSLTLELELVDEFYDPVVRPDKDASEDAKKFTPANTSIDWEIMNVMVKTDLVTLDNSLENVYNEHLLKGLAYPLNYNTFITQSQNVIGGTDAVTSTVLGQQKFSLSISRAITRLKSVFVTLDKEVPYESADRGFKARKPFNDFYSPMNDYSIGGGSNSRYNDKGEFEFQMQIGSKKYPETEIRGHAEAYYQLKKCLGIQASPVHSIDISAVEYRHTKFIIGIDTEKKLGSGFTGVSTRAGDLLTIKFAHKDTEPKT